MNFDHSRTEWYGSDGPVVNNDGSLRPRITPVSEVVIHYVGAGSSWTDLGDTAQEIRNIQTYAEGARKTWEYNVVVDSAAETWEYAGEFLAAHNGSKGLDGHFNNFTSLGILALYGLEDIAGTPVAWKFVEGIRKALRQAIFAGLLTPDFQIRRHGDVRVGGTTCPGPIGFDPYWSAIIAPLEQPSPPILGDSPMVIIPQFRSADTRVWPKVPLTAGKVYRFNVGGTVPANAKGVMATITTTEQTGGGHISVAAPGQPIGGTSANNYAPTIGAIANTTMIPCSDGQFDIRCQGGDTHVVIDVLGYYA